MLVAATCSLLITPSLACSNVLVTPSASADGNAMIGDNDDTAKRFGGVTHFAAADRPEGSTRAIYDFESAEYRGEIEQSGRILNVMGGANELGVVISESTFGGLEELGGQDYGLMDYGSLITATLQVATSARHAIATMEELTNKYGYSSSGESFSITDGTEVWHMDLIGRGQWGPGALFVAMRVPDGYISAHANQARITQFVEACEDPSQCISSPDIVSFAIEHGYYNGTVDDTSFSFSDTFDEVTVTGARFCEARVWYMFSQLADPMDFNAAEYLDYAQGFNLTNRMPLFVKAKAGGVTRQDTHDMLSSTFQGSWFDPSNDVGAGDEHSPYRWNGLSWQSAEGDAYVNERVVGTQATAWHYVAVVDPKEPAPMRALSWFGVDDHAYSPKIPLYGGATALHRSYDDGNCSARVACRQELGLPGFMMEFSWDSAFWVNSAVAQQVYAAKDRAAPIVASARCAFEAELAPKVEATADHARGLFENGHVEAGVAALTALAVEASAAATARWTALWQQLMITNVDGYTATEDPSNLLCGCKKAATALSSEFLAKVIADTGDHYRLPGEACDWIDPDGHCHHNDELTATRVPASASRRNPAKPIPKHLVRGVQP